MAASPVLLSIDLGTSGVKVLAIDPDGAVRAQTRHGYEMSFPQPGWVEQSPDDWWHATRAGIRDVLSTVPSSSIAAVGLSGQMKGLVLVDRQGRVLRPCILYSDARSHGEAEELRIRYGEEIRRRTGGWVRTAATVTKILWVRRHEPQLWLATSLFLLPKDLIRLRLTGAFATDVTDAAGTLIFDVGQRTWAFDLVERMGLETDRLPEVFEPSAVSGTVSAGAAAETGIPAGTPVVGGGADMACTVLGAGLLSPGDTSITLSAAGQVLTVSQRLEGPPGTSPNPHVLPNLAYLMGSAYAGGYSLQWARDVFGGSSSSPSLSSLSELAAEAEQVAPGADGLLFLPYLLGAGTPSFDGHLRGAFLGLAAEHRRPHFVRAVMEGVAFHLRRCIDVIEGNGTDDGLRIETAVIGAGGARNALWRQIIADVVQRPLRVPACLEFAGLGAAILAGVGAGLFEDVPSGVRAMAHPVGLVEPASGRREVYDRQYQRFQMATEWLLNAAFDRL